MLNRSEAKNIFYKRQSKSRHHHPSTYLYPTKRIPTDPSKAFLGLWMNSFRRQCQFRNFSKRRNRWKNVGERKSIFCSTNLFSQNCWKDTINELFNCRPPLPASNMIIFQLAIPDLFFIYILLFPNNCYHFNNKLMLTNVHPVSGAGIWTHDLQNMSLIR